MLLIAILGCGAIEGFEKNTARIKLVWWVIILFTAKFTLIFFDRNNF